MKKNLNFNYHSCYDELLSKLFLMSYKERSSANAKEVNNGKHGNIVSLVSDKEQLIGCVQEQYGCYYQSVVYSEITKQVKNCNYDNSFDLTAHEIIIYTLLLSKCIENQSEVQEISYKEIQMMRNKRIGKTKLLDVSTFNAYNKAFAGLSRKKLKYDLLNSRRSKKITYRKGEHPLLIVLDVKKIDNGDRYIKYSLGQFGKTLIESKRYSTLVPKSYFRINFNEVMHLQIALYVCKLLYINQRKKSKTMTLQLSSILKNITRWGESEKFGLVKLGYPMFDTNSDNNKRSWDHIVRVTIELLDTLKAELKIKDYTQSFKMIVLKNYPTACMKDFKWIIEFNK